MLHPMAMTLWMERLTLIASLGAALFACDSIQTKKDPYSLYGLDIPTSGRTYDNDSYYIPPRDYCTTIGDAPSCGGG